jgi:hypothetical protein
LEIGTYIADDWRVTSRLTINLGLRYEFLPPPSCYGQRARAQLRQGSEWPPASPATDLATVSNNPVGSLLTVPPNYSNAYAQQFNSGMEHELTATKIVLKAFYLGNFGRRLDINYNYNYNQAVPGPGAVAPRSALQHCPWCGR